jgi:hypothetical protein
MSKQVFVAAFNKQLMNFFKDVINTYPENKTLKAVRAQLRLVLTQSEKIPIEAFYEHLVLKFKTQLDAKDDKFFLSFDLTGTPLEDLNSLKQLWLTATEKSRVAMWKYVVLLQKIAEKYHA